MAAHASALKTSLLACLYSGANFTDPARLSGGIPAARFSLVLVWVTAGLLKRHFVHWGEYSALSNSLSFARVNEIYTLIPGAACMWCACERHARYMREELEKIIGVCGPSFVVCECPETLCYRTLP